MITANFLAVAEIAEVLPFLKAIRLKKLERAVSFKLPTTLAACLRAIFNACYISHNDIERKFNNRKYFCIFWEVSAACSSKLVLCLQYVLSCSVASSGKKLPLNNQMV